MAGQRQAYAVYAASLLIFLGVHNQAVEDCQHGAYDPSCCECHQHVGLHHFLL